jgi:hypothetical protein
MTSANAALIAFFIGVVIGIAWRLIQHFFGEDE